MKFRFEDFGTNVKYIRIYKNLSPQELGKKLGKSTSYISQVEKGDINANLKTIIEIAEALEVEIEQLFRAN